MYFWRTSVGPVDLAFTDRHDGVSGVPFASLNLAIEGEDDPEARRANLRRVLDDFAPGAAYADLRQVHGARVLTATAGAGVGRSEGDGLVTGDPDLVLIVRAADCVPVLLADAGTGVIGAAHAGRLGLVAGVVPEVVARMRAAGAQRIQAWVGPHVCGACYEVPAALQAEVLELVPAAAATTSWGTPSLDLGAGVRAQLEAVEVETHDVSACTRESERLYSYRRDGRHAGRQAGLVRLSPGGAA